MTVAKQANTLLKQVKGLGKNKGADIDIAVMIVEEKAKSEKAITKALSKLHDLNLGYDATYWNDVKNELKNL